MNQTEIDGNKNTRKKDLRFAGGMLGIYLACCILSIGGTFLLIKEDRKVSSANATATTKAVAAQQANATATATFRTTEHDNYEFIERFDSVSTLWYVGAYDRRFAIANTAIQDGFYIWDIEDPMGNTQGTDFTLDYKIKDFDVYIDSKFVESPGSGAVCGGLSFRRPSEDWAFGGYMFMICDDSRYNVSYYDKDGWRAITQNYDDSILSAGWNRIEIIARADDFSFFINNKHVFEMTDDSSKEGRIGIYIHVDDGNSAVLWFDNFGFQSR